MSDADVVLGVKALLAEVPPPQASVPWTVRGGRQAYAADAQDYGDHIAEFETPEDAHHAVGCVNFVRKLKEMLEK